MTRLSDLTVNTAFTINRRPFTIAQPCARVASAALGHGKQTVNGPKLQQQPLVPKSAIGSEKVHWF